MKKNLNVFSRTEIKYLLTEEQYSGLLKEFGEHIKSDPYFESFIRNLYFDTDHFELIERSMERPVFKEKMRMRSYESEHAFLEIKRKYRSQVYKRRIRTSRKAADDFSFHGTRPELSDPVDVQIMNELEYFRSYYNCRPRMYVAYDRNSYLGTEDESIRITFDTNVRYRTEDLALEDTGGETVLLGNGMPFLSQDGIEIGNKRYIMEIKVSGAMPDWMIQGLENCGAMPSSFSKYANCYLHMMRGEQ